MADDEEIARLQQNRKKRQMTVERRSRRDHQSESRKFSERRAGNRERDY